MPTFKSRIEEYVGTTGDDTALSNWLTQGARLHLRLLPPDELYRYASEQAVSTSGYAVTDSIILSVDKAGYPSTGYPSRFKARLTDSDSIYLATEQSPAHIVRAGKLYVYPGGGTAEVVVLPTVAFGDTSIDVLPADLEDATTLFASMQFVIGEVATDAAAISNTLTLPSVPTLPSIPTKSADIDTDFTTVDTRLSDDDIELAQGRLGRISGLLNDFNSDLSAYSAEVSAELQAFQAEVQSDTTEFDAENASLIQAINANLQLLGQLQAQYQTMISPYIPAEQ